MFINMILKSIPRSLRAAVALVVMLVSSQQAFTGIQALLVPAGGGASPWQAIRFGLSLLVAIAAAIAFYYFQSVDGDKPVVEHKELETLNKYAESQQEEERLKSHKATPVFSSQDGAIQPETDNKPDNL